MNPAITLPNLPSKLILLALRDLEAAEASPKYEINMGIWHTPRPNYCAVCFAGAVMANSLDVDPTLDVNPVDWPGDTSQKLMALDDFRQGYIEGGLDIMNIPHPRGLAEDFDVTNYYNNPTQFKADMICLAKLLESHKL